MTLSQPPPASCLRSAYSKRVCTDSIVDALYWTIGCMTTAGGDLHADTALLKVLYIIYMPIGAVAVLTAGRIIWETSIRRGIRLDNFTLQMHSLLAGEARRKGDRNACMREAEFIVAVLQSRKMIDVETVDAIRSQFATLVPPPIGEAGGKEAAIDAKAVFSQLVRQGRVESSARRQDEPLRDRHDDDEDKLTKVYVDTTSEDGGFQEWFEYTWAPRVEGSNSRVDGAERHDGYRPLQPLEC